MASTDWAVKILSILLAIAFHFFFFFFFDKDVCYLAIWRKDVLFGAMQRKYAKFSFIENYCVHINFFRYGKNDSIHIFTVQVYIKKP